MLYTPLHALLHILHYAIQSHTTYYHATTTTYYIVTYYYMILLHATHWYMLYTATTNTCYNTLLHATLLHTLLQKAGELHILLLLPLLLLLLLLLLLYYYY